MKSTAAADRTALAMSCRAILRSESESQSADVLMMMGVDPLTVGAKVIVVLLGPRAGCKEPLPCVL